SVLCRYWTLSRFLPYRCGGRLMMFSQEDVDKDPTAFVFELGKGYRRVGRPRIPSPPVGGASVCEPEHGEELSWHRIIPPNQPNGTYIRVQWLADKKIWRPTLETSARRVAFTSEYLAAHGWTYGEAE